MDISTGNEEIFVGNLAWHVSEEDIVKVLGPDSSEIKIFEDRATGVSKGFCRITFASRADRCRAEEILSKTLISSCVAEVSSVTDDAKLEFESRVRSREKRVWDEPDPLGLGTAHPRHRPVLIPLRSYDQSTCKPVWNRFKSEISSQLLTSTVKIDSNVEMTIERNSILTKNAIARAFSDIADKKFVSAIETLTIAATCIETCDIASNVRCQGMVSSLTELIRAFENEQKSKKFVQNTDDSAENLTLSSLSYARRSRSKSSSKTGRSLFRSNERSTRQNRRTRCDESSEARRSGISFSVASRRSRSRSNVHGSTESVSPKHSHTKTKSIPFHEKDERHSNSQRRLRAHSARRSRSRSSSDATKSLKRHYNSPSRSYETLNGSTYYYSQTNTSRKSYKYDQRTSAELQRPLRSNLQKSRATYLPPRSYKSSYNSERKSKMIDYQIAAPHKRYRYNTPSKNSKSYRNENNNEKNVYNMY